MTNEELDALVALWEVQKAEYAASNARYERQMAMIQAATNEIITIFNEPLVAFQKELRAMK
jgi:hypothetical protein